jgi:glyoxylase-like metal-dependent hydrolase (beta-lactamase superfamily II)
MQFSTFLSALGLLGTAHSHVIAQRAPQAKAPQYLPITPAQAGPEIPASGYYVESFGQGAYMVTDGSYQALFVVSTKGVIVVDCPPTIGTKLLYAIGNTTNLPITHLIYSHSHADHIGGAILLINDKVTTIAHKETANLLAPVNDPNRPLPKKTFKEYYNLKVGNQSFELSYKGQNHLEGNIFIYTPASKVLMLVDIVFPGWTPFSRLGEVKNVPGFIQAHDEILTYDFEHFIGGHLDRSGNRHDVEIQKEYVLDLYDNCAETIRLTATGDPVLGGANILSPVFAQNPENPWAAFAKYLEVTAGYCANRTNEKWVTRLAGSDVFQFDNAETMIESLRIDYGILGAFAST